MKKVFLVGLMCSLILGLFNFSLASQQKIIITDGNLIVYKQIANIPNVPEELRHEPEIAWQLVRGELLRYSPPGKSKIKNWFWGFPIKIQLEEIFPPDIFYRNNQWEKGMKFNHVLIEPVPSWKMTILLFLIPLVCILAITLLHQFSNYRERRLLLFYAVILSCLVFAGLVGFFTNFCLINILSLISIMLVCAIAGNEAEPFKFGRILGFGFGLFSGVSTILIAWNFEHFSGLINYIGKYFLFIFLSCLFSYLIAKFVKSIFISKKIKKITEF